MDSVGLCRNCQFVRIVETTRGTAFYLCERSREDRRFAKYPTLPKVACEGYVPDPKQ